MILRIDRPQVLDHTILAPTFHHGGPSGAIARDRRLELLVGQS
jgi:hypothetical protein